MTVGTTSLTTPQLKLNGRGPCEPSMTSYYAYHSQFSTRNYLTKLFLSLAQKNFLKTQLREINSYPYHEKRTNYPKATLLKNHTLRGQYFTDAKLDSTI